MVASRETTEPEDTAYSLLGLFEVQMSLLYHEGEHKAMERLRRMVGSRSTSTKYHISARAFWTAVMVGGEDPAVQPEKLRGRMEDVCLWTLEDERYDT